MRVEFLVNQDLNDGRQISVSAQELLKGKDDEEEYNSFAFASHCLFSFYGVDEFIKRDEYEMILDQLDPDGTVIISIVEEGYRSFYPEVYILNRGRLKRIEL